MAPARSSDTSSEPSFATATSTGRPRYSPVSSTKQALGERHRFFGAAVLVEGDEPAFAG